MKIITSNCEREFIYENILKGHRLDGRTPYDGRDIEIAFGKADGCCLVLLGNTRVLSVVTCEIISPKETRPAEGSLKINLDLSPMAAPHYKTGRTLDETIEVTRLLERTVRDSKCIDLESLCIVAGLKVWCIKVNIQVLNNDGNFIECASIACISSLAHFKRPEVTVIGTDVTVHSPDDHVPVALTLHHMPVIVNLAIYDEDSSILVDPLEIEERIAPGKVIIGMNAHQEICSWHLSGALLLSKDIMVQSMNIAVKRAQTCTQVIRAALDSDKYKRATNQPTGFVALMRTGTILGARQKIPHKTFFHNREEIMTSDVDENDQDMNESIEVISTPTVKEKVRKFLGTTTVAAFEGGKSQWEMGDEESESENESESEVESEAVKEEKPDVKSNSVITVSDSDENSEEETKQLKSNQIDIKDNKTASVRGWYSKNPFS